jgi:tetratricopeptide (TPR) repeat protein
MSKKKSKHARKAGEWAKQSHQGISWKTVLAILGSIAALVGAIVSGLDFINYLREGYQQFLWLGIAVLGVIWFIILWLLFKQRNIYGLLWLMVTVFAGIVVWNGWHSYIKAREEKLVVLIAKFDGPEEIYGLRNEILEKLNADFANDPDVQIESVDEVVTPEANSGSPRARELGGNLQADIVIWGWYRPTENPNITIHIENISPRQLSVMPTESTTYEPTVTLAELESFTFQQQLGNETSTLITFLEGVLKFNSEDHQAAISMFDKAISNISDQATGMLIDVSVIYYYRGSSQHLLGNYDKAIADYTKALAIKPKSDKFYLARGFVHLALREYELAIDDISKAIEIDPQYPLSYLARGSTYYYMNQYDQAIADFNKTIQVDPKNSEAYAKRGFVYSQLGQYDRAIDDYTTAIQIEPSDALTYQNRGVAYAQTSNNDAALADFTKAIDLEPERIDAYLSRGNIYGATKQYDKAFDDFDKAIQIDPNNALIYFNRGLAYNSMQEYDLAIIEFSKDIEMNPQAALTYYARGLAYQKLGKTADAEADFAKYKELTGEDVP